MKNIFTFCVLFFFVFYSHNSYGQNAICVGDTTLSISWNGSVLITADDLDNGSTDYDSLTISRNLFTCDDISDPVEVWLYAHSDNVIDSCSTMVSVEDNISPVAICDVNNQVELGPDGTVTLLPEMIDDGSVDNCAISNISITPAILNVSSPVVNVVELIVTDESGNVNRCWANVTITNSSNANLVCIPISVGAPSGTSITVNPSEFLHANSNNSNDLTLVLLDEDGNVIPDNEIDGSLPLSIFTAIVTDNIYNLSCTTDLTVNAPTLICDNATQIALGADGRAIVFASTFDDGSYGYDSLSASQMLFTCADVGGPIPVFLYGHINGRVDTCPMEVLVEDKLLPVVMCVPDNTIELTLDSSGQAILEPENVLHLGFDNCGIENMTLNQSIFTSVDAPFDEVILTITDPSGNSSNCSTQIQVGDLPTDFLICNMGETILLLPGEAIAVSPEKFLEFGPFPSWALGMHVIDEQGDTLLNDIVSSDYIGQELIVVIYDLNSDANCISNLFVLENNNPLFTCVDEAIVRLANDDFYVLMPEDVITSFIPSGYTYEIRITYPDGTLLLDQRLRENLIGEDLLFNVIINGAAVCWGNVVVRAGFHELACTDTVRVNISPGQFVQLYVDDFLEGGPYINLDSVLIIENLVSGDSVVMNIINDTHIGVPLRAFVLIEGSQIVCFTGLIIESTPPDSCPSFFICDTLAWNTPVGDCESGHTLDDWVEWPADITITSCYYSVEFLISSGLVHPNDAAPLFKGNCNQYLWGSYDDLVTTISQDSILVVRTWFFVNALDGNFWSFEQEILVAGISNCTNFVHATTIQNIDLPNVELYSGVTTNAQGEAVIVDVTSNSFLPQLVGEVKSGVDIHDFMAMKEHLVGVSPLSELGLLAADTDLDGDFTYDDLFVEFQIINELIDPTTEINWRFLGANDIREERLDKVIHAGDFLGEIVEVIGIKPGDVNGDATNFGVATDQISISPTFLFVEDEVLNRGESYTINLSIDDVDAIVGQQMSFDFDRDKIQIDQVLSPAFPDFSSDNYQIQNGETLMVIWLASDDVILQGGLEVDMNTPVLQLQITALDNGILSQSIRLTSNNRNTYVRSADNTRYNFVLEWENQIISNTVDPSGQERVVRIGPNPAQNILSIAIENDHDSAYFLTVFDGTGRKVQQKVVQNDFFQLNTTGLTNGVYYLLLTDDLGLRSQSTFIIQR